MLKVALPLVPHTLGFVLLTSSARIVMSQCKISYDDIGLFSHGSTMGDYATVITTALVTALIPQIQRTYRSGNFLAYRRLYFLCQLVAIVTSFVICIWMPEIYSILIRNARLAQSCDIACLFCFANVVSSFYIFISTPVFIQKNTLQLLWLVFVPGVLNFVSCYILIPFWGYRVAIYSTIFFYWSQLLIPFFINYYKRSLQEWMGDRHIVLIIFLVLLADLIVANGIMYSVLWVKVLMTLFVSILPYIYYKHSHIAELL
jgi:O-antigen/teichoic acid export membrane protein